MLKLAVLRQVAYAHSIRRFIRAILEKLIPGKWINRVFVAGDQEFNAKLDEAFKLMDVATATKNDYCKAVVEVLCDEVSRLCEVLKAVCEGSGYGEYFEAHVSHERFVRLVLSNDSVKLGRMKKVVADKSLSPIDILREIGAILNEESLEERVALCANERRKANAEIKAIAADVKSTMQTGFAEVKDEIKSGVAAIGAKVDIVDAKVSEPKRRRKRRSKYDESVTSFCVACVEAAQKDSMLVRSGNGKPKTEDVFSRYRSKLRDKGIVDVVTFKKILHACRARESRDRVRKLEAQQSAAKSNNKTPTKNGIITAVKKNASAAVSIALAIACAAAAPL